MINALFLHPLGPALVLALGGLLLRLGRGLFHGPVWSRSPAASVLHRYRHDFHLSIALLTLLVASVNLLLLRLPGLARTGLEWVWQPLTVAGSSLSWHSDGWSWLAALVILLLTAVALLLAERDEDEPIADANYERTLWLASAALTFVFSSNVVTLASCWVLLDAALALRLQSVRGAEPAGRAWGLLSMAGMVLLVVLTLLGEDGSRATLLSGFFTRLELALLWLAGLIRAGVYPLHFWLMGPGVLDDGDRVALHLIVPVTGLWLLARVHGVAGAGWLRQPQWAALGALALFGTALAAWSTDDERWRWRWLVLNRASLAVFAAYVTGSDGPEALVWATIVFSLGGALLLVGQIARQRWGWTLPAWMSLLILWGLPGTPGFLARSVLIFPTGLAVAIPIFGVILVAETLLVAALWQVVVGRAEFRATTTDNADFVPTRGAWYRLLLAMSLLIVPIVALGVAPRLVASLGSTRPSDAFPTLFRALIGARRSVWIGLIFSGVAGVWLGIRRRVILSTMRGWQRGIARIVSLEWAYRLAVGLLAAMGSGLRYFATLGEGEGYLGWLALAGLILWVLLRG